MWSLAKGYIERRNKSWFTNLQLQSCNVSIFRIQSTNIAFTEYKNYILQISVYKSEMT